MIIDKNGVHGDVKTMRVIANGKDISQAVSQIIINQSIFNPFWYAELVVNDTTNLKTLVPLTNACEFQITIETSVGSKFDGSVTYNFRMQSIVNANQVNHMHTTYIVHLVDEIAFLNNYTLVSKVFQNERASDAVTSLCFDYMGYTVKTDQSDNSLTAVIPNIKPLEAINWVAKSATYRGGGDYTFFQIGNKRMAFKSVLGMYDDSSNASGLVFDRRPTNYTKELDNGYDYSFNMMQVSLTYPDVLLDSLSGYYGSKVYHFDLTKKSHNTWTYDTTHDVIYDSKDKVYEGIRASAETVNKDIYKIDGVSPFGNSIAEDYTRWIGTRRVGLASPSRNMLVIQTTGLGQHGQMVGKTAIVNLPSQQDTTDDRDDKEYSGKYLITKITQRVNGTKYITNFELIKLDIK